MRLWVLWPLGLGTACHSIDEATMQQFARGVHDIEWASDEARDGLISDGLGSVLSGYGPDAPEVMALHDGLIWPALEDVDPMYTPVGRRYAMDSISWCLRTPSEGDFDGDGDADMSEWGQEAALQAAADEWFWNAGVVIYQVECPADLEVSFLSSGEDRWEDRFSVEADPTGETLARTPPVLENWTYIYFDDEKSWSLSTRGTDRGAPFDFQAVALHEMGHALGLCHAEGSPGFTCESTVGTDLCPAADGTYSVMCPFYVGSNRTLKTDDVDGIQSIYGESQHVCADGYNLAYRAYLALHQAWTDTTRMSECLPDSVHLAFAVDQLFLATEYAKKMEGAAEDARDDDPAFGVEATRHLYEAQTNARSVLPWLEESEVYAGCRDPTIYAEDLVDKVTNAINLMSIVYVLEDYCYVLEYGEHEEGS